MLQMKSTERFTERAAFCLAFGSAVGILLSIAVSQILLALALAALLISGEKLRLPPIRLPLALFLTGTIISLALSPDPAAGFPQIRKFYVFLILLVVYSTFHSLREVRWLVLSWSGVAAISAGFSLIQFAHKHQEASHLGRDFYQYYIPDRITGFMSHWMTFGGQEMIVLLLLAAFLLFSPGARGRSLWFGLVCAGALLLSLVLGMTRGIWLASACSAMYLVWFWRRWLVLAVPLALLVGILAAPVSLRERVNSVFRPHGYADSNQFRIVTWQTGWRMIKAHPWFGLGPEEVRLRFQEYVAPDAPKPLPTGWYGHLHNIYLHYAAERGIPTLLVLLWMLGKILRDFTRAIRTAEGDGKFVLHGGIAVVLAILISGFFELNLGDSEILTMFLVAVACGYIACGAHSERPFSRQ
jgi:putative inorganic carbon (HCO3(-)) transporter